MHRYRQSYAKTVALFAAVAVVFAAALALTAAAGLPPWATLAVGFMCGAIVSWAVLVIGSGLLVLYRDRCISRGEEDLFLRANRARSEERLAVSRRPQRRPLLRLAKLRRTLGRSRFVVGDLVEVRSPREIEATLDESGGLDGLPFMPEMIPHCGKTFRVFRCIDKVYDYGGAKNLRRMDDAYLLTRVRCDGGKHDGCSAGCYVIWRSAWLKEADRDHAPETSRDSSTDVDRLERRLVTRAADKSRYVCQYTQLCAASDSAVSPANRWRTLRPIVLGNFTFAAFLVAVMTQLFNRVQVRRSGASYPFIGATSAPRSAPGDSGLQPGERVRVLPVAEIVATLDGGGKNAGLWFDRDMVRHCNRQFVVARRVQRIIDDATGRMLRMRTPCIVLEGIDGSGEFLRLCAQHDQPFWRESWLERVGTAPLESNDAGIAASAD